MYINQTFELCMVLDNEKFQKVLNRAYKKAGYLEDDEGEYIDRSLAHKGITFMYRDSRYKKKIRIIADAGQASNADKFIRKLDKHIKEYFGFKYQMGDFSLSGMRLTVDIDVRSKGNVSDYLKVLQRIGRVKGFSPSDYDCFDDVGSFCLEGNSNGIEFLLYDLEGLITDQLRKNDSNRKKMKEMVKDAGGIIRTEVRLTKTKTIRNYTDTDDLYGQLVILSQKCQDIFLDVFMRIIPFGDYYKKDKAIEVIRKEIKDDVLRRKMIHLVALIPEKKSLYLAQKAMNCRNIEKVMDAFAKISMSPITISKRHDVKYLKNLYSYLCRCS